MTLIDERRRRIVTTHVGSLPRPNSLSAKLFARMTKQPYDAQAFARELGEAVGAIVKRQADLDIDVVSDGEFSKTSFQYYVTERLGGLEPITPTAGHRVTTYREQRALCPAAAAEGHEWFAVPDLSLDVLAGFGWIPRDVAEDEEGQATVGTGVHA